MMVWDDLLLCIQVWKQAWQNIDGVDKVFSCGRLKEQEIFVARQACKGKYSYYICAFAE